MGFFDKLFGAQNSCPSTTIEDYKTLFRLVLAWKEQGGCPFNEMYVFYIKKDDGYYLRIIFWWHYCGRSGIELFSNNQFWDLIIKNFDFKYNDHDFADSCFVSESIKIQNITPTKAMQQIKQFSYEYSASFDELEVFTELDVR